MESSPLWEELAAPSWHNVFVMLCPKDLTSLMLTCRSLHDLANAVTVWQAQCDKWPRALAQPHFGGYVSHKALILDDNRRTAVLSLPLHEAVCNYRYQRHSYFFQCRMLHLQWWRANNSLRLYFDVRGEPDLRHPISSSVAVVQLKAGQQQAEQHASGPSAAAGALHGLGTNSPAAATDDEQGSLWYQQQLCVHYPDSCELITDKEGHYKGVLTWDSAKCCEILGHLLPPSGQQQQQQQRSPPEQHRHLQRGRRSQAWEDWAEWQLQHQESGNIHDWGSHETIAPPPPPPAVAAAGPGAGGVQPYWFLNVWPAVSTHPSSAGALSQAGGGNASTCTGDGGSVAAPRGLVFCYANDLSLYTDDSVLMYGRPDYSPALLVKNIATAAHQHVATCCDRSAAAAAATTVGSSSAPSTAAQAGTAAVAGSATVELHSAPGATGQNCTLADHVASRLNTSLALPLQPLQLPVQLHCQHEPCWVHAWLQLPGACVMQRGLADKQLREESDADERDRWRDLPAAVKRRGAAWWK